MWEQEPGAVGTLYLFKHLNYTWKKFCMRCIIVFDSFPPKSYTPSEIQDTEEVLLRTSNSINIGTSDIIN